MDDHVLEFYTPFSKNQEKGQFYSVIPLHDEKHLSWDILSKKVPSLCKGWFELAKLPTNDRLEFTFDFWVATLPYHPTFIDSLEQFFSNLDDIGIFAVQTKKENSYDVHFVYSLKENGGYFYGKHPAREEEINLLKKQFSSFILPLDYIRFLQIHNGFSKSTDTGISGSDQLNDKYQQFQTYLSSIETVVTTKGNPVDATTLIPFYESFGRPYYQCFLGDWYPDQEMGNVYFSGDTHTVSDYKKPGTENLAFPSFLDWLTFYLEKIN